MDSDEKLKIAILDLYDNHPNEGMRCIRELIESHPVPFEYQIFDVRNKGEIPDLSFDAYISTGGPGDPAEFNPLWSLKWAAWIDGIIEYNKQHIAHSKQVLLICHSFQLICLQLKVGKVSLRHSPSFGILPVHLTSQGKKEVFFHGMHDPFHAVDSRSYQILSRDENMPGAYSVLAIEKERNYVNYERAIMAVRFSDEIFATQFHPEADPVGMGIYFEKPEKQKQIIAEHGQAKYTEMMNSLYDPEKLFKTYTTLIPAFLKNIYTSKALNK